MPAKQGKQNPWKVNHSEEFQRSGNRASKKCTRRGKSPMHGRKDCPTKDAECRKCFVKGHCASMCRSKKTLRRLEEDEDRYMSYWVSSQRSIPERERNRGEQPQSTLWNSKTRGTQKSWSTAKRLTLEWTPEPMSQSSQEDTSLRTLR